MAPLARHRWLRRLLVVFAVVAVLVAAGALLLDRLLLGRARAEAAVLSRQWGRPVEIGDLTTKLVPWLGVRVSGLRVGAAPGEPRPLLELDRAEVRVGLAGALRSLGKRVEVRAIELAGLRVNVLRLPDGATNLERLAEAASRGSPDAREPAPGPAKPPADLSFLRVDRASLSGARVAFLDLTRPGARELAVDKLEVAVEDLAAGEPLDVVLRAAVLSEAQNLEVRLHAAPLPVTLRPTPQRLTVKLAPVALDPLAPFLPRSAGFLAGQLSVDLDANLGAAAPGGTGRTALAGKINARGLRFAGQEGGRPLDVLLDVDVTGDATKGDVRIAKLELTAGPVAIHGSGGATGLIGGEPRVEGLRVTADGLDPRAIAAFYPPLARAVGEQAVGPATFSLRAAGEAGAPAIEARLDLAGVKLAIPARLAKAARAPLSLTVRVAFPGGAAGRARGATALVVDARADATGVDLRPGGSLAKAPGERLTADAHVEATGKPGGAWEVALKKLDLGLPGDAVSASGTAALSGEGRARKVRFDVAVESARLDLDRLLSTAPPPKKKDETPVDPATFAGLAGTAQVRIGELRWSRQSFRDVAVRVKLEGDDLLVEQAHLSALGGQLDAGGTRMRLAHPTEPMHVKVKLTGVDAGEALALYTPRKLLGGRVSADLDVSAGGASRTDLLSSLTGSLGGTLFDGAFFGKDLVAGVAGPLARALPFGATKKLAEGGATSLGKELPFGVRFSGGTAQISKPLRVQSAGAALAVEGGSVKLDGTLDVPLTVALSPELVASLTGGRAKPDGPIPIAARLTGPAWSPSLGDLSLQPAVTAIVRSAGTAALGKLLGVGAPGGQPPGLVPVLRRMRRTHSASPRRLARGRRPRARRPCRACSGSDAHRRAAP